MNVIRWIGAWIFVYLFAVDDWFHRDPEADA